MKANKIYYFSDLFDKELYIYKKLYTVLSYLGAFTLCTCCILICLGCIVARFKLSCVKLLLV